jgi:hypothetical protein
MNGAVSPVELTALHFEIRPVLHWPDGHGGDVCGVSPFGLLCDVCVSDKTISALGESWITPYKMGG